MPTPRRALRRKLYALLCNLTDACVWLVEYASAENSARSKAAAAALINELEQHIRGASGQA